MSWVATAIVTSAVIGAGTSMYQADKAEEAAEDAERQAEEDRLRAEKAAKLADREGGGIGSLGKIDLAIDDEIDENRTVGGSISI